jgi:hypothetical protein
MKILPSNPLVRIIARSFGPRHCAIVQFGLAVSNGWAAASKIRPSAFVDGEGDVDVVLMEMFRRSQGTAMQYGI